MRQLAIGLILVILIVGSYLFVHQDMYYAESSFLEQLTLVPTPSFRVITSVYEDLTPYSSQDVSLVTHMSTDRLDRLQALRNVWDGPISCVMYIRSTREAQQLDIFAKEHFVGNIDIHVMYEPHGEAYPMNILRNIAMNHALTDFVLVLDADFVPSRGLHATLLNDTKSLERLRSRTLMVLPAFEYRQGSDTDPLDKKEVIEMAQLEELGQFHGYYPPGHRATNYSHWYQAQEPYDITYEAGFEPYVVAYRPGLPQFWEEFRGFGFDKLSWFMHLHFMQYQFFVAPYGFVLHHDHLDGGKGRKASKANTREWIRFKKFLMKAYGATPDQM